jgi:transposase
MDTNNTIDHGGKDRSLIQVNAAAFALQIESRRSCARRRPRPKCYGGEPIGPGQDGSALFLMGRFDGGGSADMPPCLIGMEACVGAHHLSRKLQSLGHDARLMPAKYVRPYGKGQKKDFRDGETIAEAVQRPTMKFVATKTAEQLDLQALHRVRERLVSQRTGIINQIRTFLLERGVPVRQGPRFLRTELPNILAKRSDVLSPRMTRIIEELAGDWHRLDERIQGLSTDIKALADQHSRARWWRRSATARRSRRDATSAWNGPQGSGRASGCRASRQHLRSPALKTRLRAGTRRRGSGSRPHERETLPPLSDY